LLVDWRGFCVAFSFLLCVVYSFVIKSIKSNDLYFPSLSQIVNPASRLEGDATIAVTEITFTSLQNIAQAFSVPGMLKLKICVKATAEIGGSTSNVSPVKISSVNFLGK